jgi:hypothetical protein
MAISRGSIPDSASLRTQVPPLNRPRPRHDLSPPQYQQRDHEADSRIEGKEDDEEC